MAGIAMAVNVIPAAAAPRGPAFQDFVKDYGRKYSSPEEESLRFDIFRRNADWVESWNADNNSHTAAINFFADLTIEETKHYLGYIPRNVSKNFRKEPAVLDTSNLAGGVNWVTAGATTPVKNQGQCGSCWAFASISTVESAHKITSGTLLSLSEQQLVDCVQLCHGCNGGNAGSAYGYLGPKPAMLESDYAYTAQDGTCKFNKFKGRVKVNTFKYPASGSKAALMAAIATTPTYVAIQANQFVFQSYKSGIFDSPSCGGSHLDHAVAAVGYGWWGMQGYYIVRNSWGASWGEQGYIRIAIASDGQGICGIQKEPVYPVTN